MLDEAASEEEVLRFLVEELTTVSDESRQALYQAKSLAGGACRRAGQVGVLDWFNHKRLLGPIGDIPPAEAEANYYQQTRDLAMAA